MAGLLSGREKALTWAFAILLALNLTIGKEVYTQGGVDRLLSSPSCLVRNGLAALALAFLTVLALELFFEADRRGSGRKAKG